jgi:hypothetical protein
MFKRLSSLNLFVSDPPSTEKQYENHEIVATRLYIFLFVLSIIVALLSYGPFNKETKLIKIKNPSIDIINNLHKKNVSSLSCPCSKVAIHYSKFLSVKYKFHPICSSEFVSPLFLLNLNDNISDQLIAHYRILSSLCNISNEYLQNADKSFANRELITVEPLTESSFNIEIKSLISNFLRQIRSDYRRRFSFIINSFSVNQLLNLFRNNWRIDFTNKTEKYLIKTIPYRFPLTNCTCAISSNCNQQLIQNIYIGCFPYDGFRLSKFKKISLGKLNYQLFIQKSINKTNYTNYFETCQPLECQYKLPDKNNPIVMFTTFLGLYGGLTYFLRLIIGQSLLAYRWWVKRKRESF